MQTISEVGGGGVFVKHGGTINGLIYGSPMVGREVVISRGIILG